MTLTPTFQLYRLDRAKRPPVAAVFRHLADDIADRIGLYEVTAAGEPLRLL